uniref:NADH-ubiquinone oxidoreductase chain 4 n=1 Tax=Paraleius leontonychus TaxID=1807943 RepID=A0A330JFU1_9ACAR|nr:NADH dehydrogenase subunit 4 [Paraleius leontonychus]
MGMMFSFLLISFSCFSLLVFYFSFEFLFLLMFFFLLSWGYSPERLQASFYMIFYTIVVSFPFLVYIVVMGEAAFYVFGLFLEIQSYWWVFFLLVFLVKLPVYGAHLWLPKAHVEAPVSGSMLLAGVLLKLGGYGLVRFLGNFLSKVFVFKGYLVSLGLLGGLFSCYLCLRQSDMKALVAYSSVCHMGFALAGILSGNCLGYSGGVLMLVAHGYCSSCLFYILYVLYERFHSRSSLVLKGLGGILPLLGGIWFFFSALNMGVPPFYSFFSEILIFSSLLSTSLTTFFSGGMILFFAGIYCVYMYVFCFHGKSINEGSVSFLSLRECLNLYSHSFYMIFSLFFFFFYL